MDKILSNPNDCPIENIDCQDRVYYAWTVMSASLKRFFKGDFSYWDNDLYILMFFISFCSWSGLLVYGVSRLLSCTKEARKARAIRDQLLNNPDFANSPYRVVLVPPGGEYEAGDIVTRQPPVDHRATGDGWQAHELDPDYDVNNDVLVMMLEGNHDEEEGSEDGGSGIESDEDVEVLHRIIMAETDEEAMSYAIHGSVNNEEHVIQEQNQEDADGGVDNGGQEVEDIARAE